MGETRVELGYKVRVEGAPELKALAESQRQVHKATADANQVLGEADRKFRQAASGADLLSKKGEQARRSAFKRGEDGSSDLAEEARIKSLSKAHQQLDREIEQQQLRQLKGLERINAERRKAISDLSGFGDRALLQKVDQVFNAKAGAFHNQNPLRPPSPSPGGGGAGGIGVGQLLSGLGSGRGALTLAGNQSEVAFSGTAIAVAAVGAGLLAATAAAVHLVQESGKFAEHITNSADRLGLTAVEMLKLSSAAEIAGVNIGAIESSAKLLANALEDPTGGGRKVSDELHKLGVDTYDAKGKIREMGPVLLDFLEKLSKIESGTERTATALRVLGKGGKELLPLIKDYAGLNKTIDDLRINLTGPVLKSLNEVDDKFDKLGLAYKLLKLRLADKIAPIVVPVIEFITKVLNNEGPDENFGLHPEAAAAAYAKKLREKPVLDAKEGKEAPISDARRAANEADAERERKRFGNTLEGLEERKHSLEKTIKENQAKLENPSFGGVDGQRAIASQARDSAQKEVRSIEEQIKARRKTEGEYGRLKTELEAIQKRSNEFELTGLEKITAQQDEYNQKVKESHVSLAKKNQLIGDAAKAFDKERAKDTNKEEATRLREELVLRQRLLEFQIGAGRPLDVITGRFGLETETANAAFAKDGDTRSRDKALAGAKNRRDEGLISLFESESAKVQAQLNASSSIKVGNQAGLEEARVGFNLTGTFNKSDEIARAKELSRIRLEAAKEDADIRARGAGPEGKAAASREKELADLKEAGALKRELLSIDQQAARIALEVRVRNLQALAEQKVRTLELTTGPGSEISNVERIYNIRRQLALQEFALRNDQNELDRKFQDAEFERTNALLALRKKGLDEFRQGFGQFVDALSSKGLSGAGDFFANFGKNIGKTLLTNLATEGFSKVRDKIPQLGGQTNPNGTPTLLGKILANTPLAARVDPLKIATDANTEATIANTIALGKFSAGSGGTGAGLPKVVGDGDAEAEDAGGEAAGGGTSGGGTSSFGKIMKYAGIAGSVAGGILGVKAGIQQGGARGALGATSSALGATAGVLAATGVGAPIAAGLAVAALGLNLIKGFLGDPRKKREEALDKELAQAKYTAPKSVAVSQDSSGREVDRDFLGRLRVLKNAPRAEFYNDITGIDPLHPGQLLSSSQRRLSLSGAALGPNAFSTAQATPPATNVYHITIPVKAIDSKGFKDHHKDIADSLFVALQTQHPVRGAIQRTVKAY